ncbi:U4/U6-U5 snRNP complex subunit lsm6 [Microbotryomycetes sp. JL221]|nr:U4/U6-U5 snRNP complex subunit lsm6 [Microbotryomycetes sp. JL221]
MADNGASASPPADQHDQQQEQQQAEEPASGTPGDFLKTVVGENVVVRLNSGVDYRGILSCLDGYMNIALENTQEYVNGVHTNSYGDAFIRGNNVLYISKMAV